MHYKAQVQAHVLLILGWYTTHTGEACLIREWLWALGNNFRGLGNHSRGLGNFPGVFINELCKLHPERDLLQRGRRLVCSMRTRAPSQSRASHRTAQRCRVASMKLVHSTAHLTVPDEALSQSRCCSRNSAATASRTAYALRVAGMAWHSRHVGS
eukprot:1376901-Rhodomonas_salina.4